VGPVQHRRTVLVAHPSPDLYGSDRVALASVEALVARGWRVVTTVPQEGPLVGPLRRAGADVVVCPTPVLRKAVLRPAGLLRMLATSVGSIAPAVRLMRRHRPDVVYVSTLTAPLWPLLARACGRPLVCHVHEAEAGAPTLLQRALAAPLLASSSVIANSRFTRDTLSAAIPRLRARTSVVTNPVRGPERVSAPRDELAGPVRLLYVGRLSPRKGPQVAIEAIAELRARGVAVHLDLLGSTFPGYEWFERDLREDVSRRGLDGRVAFLGFRADVWSAVAAADVVVIPSVADESFGNAAVEALLGARPVIVSDAAGLAEAVADHASAHVVPRGDATALADAVEKVVANWRQQRAAARAGATAAAERHATARYGDRLHELMTRVATEVRSGSAVTSLPASTASRPRLVVVIPTYRRPDDLRAAVPLVLAQLEDAPCDGAVVVVDNDPSGGALNLAAEMADDRIRFVHEPAPGIAAARNRGLDEAGDADLLVFIDDDERPEPGWLRNLVGEWLRTRPAAVVGPVVSVYEREPEPWIAAGRFFTGRRRLPTGTEIDVAATNNLLLDLRQVRAAGVRFDLRFGTSGGEDTLFTRQLHRCGGRMVWCDEAVVLDVVPGVRLTRRFIARRAFRYGNSWSRVSLALESGRVARAVRRVVLSAQGLSRVAAGSARVGSGVVLASMRHRAMGTRTLLRGLGMVSGAWGYAYVEYARGSVPGTGAQGVIR
jgi:glycosyltransferase involved in cell wall biosynthesis